MWTGVKARKKEVFQHSMADATCGSVIGIHRYQHSSHGQLTFKADDRRGEKIPNERKTQNEVFNFITPLAELGTLGVKEERGGQVSLHCIRQQC